MVTLTADPELILLEPNKTEGTTDITYRDKRPSDVVWHRMGPNPTAKWGEAIDTSVLPAKEEQNAQVELTFTSPPIGAGRVYQVRIMQEGADPNKTLPEGVVAGVDVLCLRKEPEVRKFITDENGPEVGGTFVWLKIFTEVPTFKQLFVGTAEPRTFIKGMLKFRDEHFLGATPVPTALTNEQELEFSGLMPGNTHFALVLVSDHNGNWQQKLYEFVTLQREVTVRFTKMDITNDGDPFDDSNADFNFEILSSSAANPHGAKMRSEKTFSFNKDISTGQSIPLSLSHTMGPERVSGDNRFVLVNIRGEDIDGIFEPNERASNFVGDAVLNMPEGRGREEVSKSPKSVWARPENGSDFNFYLHFNYDVKYSAP